MPKCKACDGKKWIVIDTIKAVNQDIMSPCPECCLHPHGLTQKLGYRVCMECGKIFKQKEEIAFTTLTEL